MELDEGEEEDEDVAAPEEREDQTKGLINIYTTIERKKTPVLSTKILLYSLKSAG